jgi:hypothetical protein
MYSMGLEVGSLGHVPNDVPVRIQLNEKVPKGQG